MPCAGTEYSCNSLISIRSPLGEIRLGGPGSANPAPQPLWLVMRTFLMFREALAHRRQRRALRRLDPHLQRDIGVSGAELEREASRPFRIRVDEAPAQTSRQSSRLVQAFRAAAEWLAREQLRHAGREIDSRKLDELAVSDPETARELRKLFDL
jgi:uncharacterized protein YjiS (DUF1127 family)